MLGWAHYKTSRHIIGERKRAYFNRAEECNIELYGACFNPEDALRRGDLARHCFGEIESWSIAQPLVWLIIYADQPIPSKFL